VANRGTIVAHWLLPVALALAGCRSSTFTPPQTPPDPLSKPAPEDLELLRSTRDLGEEYSYPPGVTTQTLRWYEDIIEWSLRLARRGYAYGGISLRKPYDFSKHKSETVMSFEFTPASMAPYVSIGLVDGDIAKNHVLVDIPLSELVQETGDGTVRVRIPLDRFGNEGLPVAGPGEAPHVAGRMPFDWSDVREIRISSLGSLPARGIIVREMRFRR
jgi:hypothetical protein